MNAATTLAVGVINGNPVERILVIAPSYRYFGEWCHQNGINYRAPNIRYVHRQYDLRGYQDAWYVNLGAPRCREGDGVLELLEHMKATRGFRSAEAMPRG